MIHGLIITQHAERATRNCSGAVDYHLLFRFSGTPHMSGGSNSGGAGNDVVSVPA